MRSMRADRNFDHRKKASILIKIHFSIDQKSKAHILPEITSFRL